MRFYGAFFFVCFFFFLVIVFLFVVLFLWRIHKDVDKVPRRPDRKHKTTDSQNRSNDDRTNCAAVERVLLPRPTTRTRGIVLLTNLFVDRANLAHVELIGGETEGVVTTGGGVELDAVEEGLTTLCVEDTV